MWEGLHPHAFRHFVATRLDAARWSAREIADYLGHDRISTTQDEYLDRHVAGDYRQTKWRSWSRRIDGERRSDHWLSDLGSSSHDQPALDTGWCGEAAGREDDQGGRGAGIEAVRRRLEYAEAGSGARSQLEYGVQGVGTSWGRHATARSVTQADERRCTVGPCLGPALCPQASSPL
ncbi:MAG TPA: site-specific integrase [Pseudonocardiaceae bacterium]